MTAPDRTELEYYSSPGIMTDPGEYRRLFSDLPRGIPELCQVVQGLLLHIFWAERYGCPLSEERKQEVQIRTVGHKLARILELDPRPLASARPLDKRLVGNCRDFTVLLTAMLRHQGVPARARCGFGKYFWPGHYEDHWVCEYWNPEAGRWIMVDSQLDEFQRGALHIRFDVNDLPAGAFVNGGQAWQLCRSGQANPDSFGIFDMHGLWFVRGDLVRDWLALNKVEILPWDHWGVMSKRDGEMTAQETALMDQIAALCTGPAGFAEMRALYESNPALQPPVDSIPEMQRASRGLTADIP